jgi:hypothetical protein
MVKKALKVSLVPIYNAAYMPLLIAKNTGFEQRQISLAAIATREIYLSSQPVFYDQYFVHKFVYDVEYILMRSSE